MRKLCALLFVALTGVYAVPSSAQVDTTTVVLLCRDCPDLEVAVSVPAWMYEGRGRADGIDSWWKPLVDRLEWTRLPGGDDLPRSPRTPRPDCRTIGTELNRVNWITMRADDVVERMVITEAVVLVDRSGRHARRGAGSRGYGQALARWRDGLQRAASSSRNLLRVWIDNECGQVKGAGP